MAETVLRKDSEWSVIDGEPCKVVSFNPSASIENDRVISPNKTEPYASVILECKKYPSPIKGFICHKMDFMHLWLAFKERGIKQDEEVLIVWSKKSYKNIVYKMFSAFMPRLWVAVCPEGAFKLETDSNYKPELMGEARFIAARPIVEWKPEVIG